MNEFPQNLMTPQQAAAFLAISENTLSTWRSRRGRVSRDGIGGPPFLRAGRSIRYRKQDLEQWMRSFQPPPQVIPKS